MSIVLNELRCVCEDVNLDDYINFRDYVKKHMEHPEWLGDFTKDELIVLLTNGSKIWFYYMDKEPVCSMMAIPSTKKDLDKFNICYDYKEVIDYGPMMVSPKFIGNGLQYQMLKEIDNYSKNHGYKYSVGTIHPDNVFSINNLVKDEFKLINTKEFTRGTRNIYLKKF